MEKKFDPEKAKKFLAEREEKERDKQESDRKVLLEAVISLLKEEFQGTSVEVYLIGSILQPFRFSAHSDVDVVLKNYDGDRFDFWTKFEGKIGRTAEIIRFETCPFQEFVIKNGFKVI